MIARNCSDPVLGYAMVDWQRNCVVENQHMCIVTTTQLRCNHNAPTQLRYNRNAMTQLRYDHKELVL
jgi:hypothetical protein